MAGTLHQALSVNVLVGVGTHLYYRAYEPENYWKLAGVVLSLPLAPASLLVPHVSSIGSAVGLAFSVFFTSLFSSMVLYRVSPLHPLAGYPGPLLWRITKFAPAYYGLKGKHHIQLKKLHETYGPIVRIGPNELSIVDTDLIPFILGVQGMPKGPLWEGRRVLPSKNYNINNSLVAVRDLERHSELRKPWNKAFGTGPLKDYEEMLIARAGLLVERLESHCRSARDKIARVDLAKWASFFAFDFMGDIAFNSDFSLLQEGDVNGFVKNMEEAHFLPTIVQHIPWAAKITRVTPGIGSKLQRFGAFALDQARKRAARTMLHKDLFYHLIQATDPDLTTSPLPLIMSNTILTIIAGSDTTASAIAVIFFLLLRNPESHKRLQNEIDAAVAHGGDPLLSPDKLVHLPYLNAVVNEALRILPPVATSVQRCPKAGSGGKMLGSMLLPEGTSILLPPYVYHRDPRYFSNPDTFWPERWLSSEEDDKVVHERAAFIPFSTGPANCAGKPLAMMELRYVTASLIRNFDMTLDETFDAEAWVDGLKDRLVLCKDPLPVRLTKRKPFA